MGFAPLRRRALRSCLQRALFRFGRFQIPDGSHPTRGARIIVMPGSIVFRRSGVVAGGREEEARPPVGAHSNAAPIFPAAAQITAGRRRPDGRLNLLARSHDPWEPDRKLAAMQ